MKDPHKNLDRLLKRKDFKSEKDLKDFLDSLIGTQLPDADDLTDSEKAQDLIEEAQDLPPKQALVLIDEALRLNPDCIEAYEFLAQREHIIENKMRLYKKGVDIGKRIFGGKYLDEKKGHFWGFTETRPFMRCMFGYADHLYLSGQKNEAIEVFEEIIELNNNDNMGARDFLMTYLLEADRYDDFEKFSEMFKTDIGAFYYFNLVLYLFKKEGESYKTNTLLGRAIKENKFVLPMIISSKIQNQTPSSYAIGSRDEAKYYSAITQKIWQQTPGAIKWMMKFRNKTTE